MQYQNGRHKVKWLRPEEDDYDDDYHSIAHYTNGRCAGFMHTQCEERARELFKDMCAMIDGFSKRREV